MDAFTEIRKSGSLVLSRMPDEAIVVEVPPSTEATLIRIFIAGVHGDKVRLGSQAARDVIVHREEIYKMLSRRKDRGQ